MELATSAPATPSPLDVSAIPSDSRAFPRVRNKIKDNPALEYLVDEMLWMKMTYKQICDCLLQDHGVTVSVDTVGRYKTGFFDEKFKRASAIERAAWEKRADSNIDIYKTMYANREELIREQVRLVKIIQKKLEEAADDDNKQSKYDGAMLSSLARTMKEVREAQKDLNQMVEELQNNKNLINAVKAKTGEAVAMLLLPKIKLEERERNVLLKQIEITVRTLEIG